MKRERLTNIWPENNGTVFAGHMGIDFQHNVYRARGTDDWQIMAPTGGSGRIGSVNGDFVMRPGEVALMRPGVLHDYGPLEPTWAYTWVHFQPRREWLDLLNWPELAPGLMRINLDDPELRERIETALARTLTRYQGPYDRRQLFALNALEEALLWCDLQNPLSHSGGIDPRIMRVVAYLNENLTERTTLAALADLAGMSVSHLSHLFYRQIGMGPIKYLDIQRLEHARRLLEKTDLPVGAIAERAGFELRYFSLHFKQHTTLSPRDYRKRASAKSPANTPILP